MASKEEISGFLLRLLHYIANEINESDNQPHLNKNTYEAINYTSNFMYDNNLSNYAMLYSCLYTKHHYNFLTEPEQINVNYPLRNAECNESISESRKKYKNIPTVFSFHDVFDFIVKNDIPSLANILFENQELFTKLKNGIEAKLRLY
jgi:hypothetical protein